jgi:2-polyprenyl-6-methoxyphenol hydroxylase-like FAD-dependent oxidoreductase
MEHFRRLGFVEEVRQQGLPDDYPTDIAYFTRFSAYELGRFKLPAAGELDEIAKSSAAWNAAELPHRVSQKFVEAALHRHAGELRSVSLNYSWRLNSFHDDGDGVEAVIAHVGDGTERRIRADYLFGADGPRSSVRRALGFDYEGEAGAERDFMGGRMLAIYFKAPKFYELCRGPKAWMYSSFNAQRRCLLIAVDGKSEFVFHTQLRADEVDRLTEADPLRYLEQAMGVPMPVDVLATDLWLAGRALVAEGFQRGRVFLGGDAVHLFTPTGGMGYNTAIEDAVNIGWKFAMVLKRQAASALLDSYQAERRPVARRNTGFARQFADSIGLYRPTPAIERPGAAGDAARRRAGVYLADHASAEFNIPGFTFGYRYDGSPIIAADPAPLPPDKPNAYVPTGKPGGRAPHVWLGDGRSLYDTFGFEFTLLVLGAEAADVAPFTAAARETGIDLKVVSCDSEEAADLYESDLVLIRPDQVVAWRRTAAAYDPGKVLALATGSAVAERAAA